MPIEVYPVPVTSSSDASSITATTSNTMYEGRTSLDPAIYEITCASGTITNIQFFSGAGTLIISTVTVSGTVSINLASAADRVRLWTDTGSNIVVTITKTAAALSNVFSGTLDTITSTGTYTGTSTSGYGYAVLVGGGGGGGSVTAGGINRKGGGGGSGSVGGKYLALTGSMEVVIGAAGLGIVGSTGGTGGTSTFGGMSCPGGSGGQLGPTDTNPGQGGAGGGTPTGADVSSAGAVGGQAGSYNYGTTTKIYSFVINGTTGGGQGAFYNTPDPQSGGGSGIGTGGGGASQNNGLNATGYGAGGGGAGNREVNAAYKGGNGTPGVLYVLRF
jgi:hypothetical protein